MSSLSYFVLFCFFRFLSARETYAELELSNSGGARVPYLPTRSLSLDRFTLGEEIRGGRRKRVGFGVDAESGPIIVNSDAAGRFLVYHIAVCH